jgi:UDP-GlcNAc:undecaprenyl-phosphate GlcNAc-1-phosphate transferase
MIQFGDMNLLNLGAIFGGNVVILPNYLGFIFTIFCVVGIINAFNWIDGIDGFFSFQVILALIGLSAMGAAGFTLAHFSFLAALLPYSLMNIGLLGNKFKVFIGDHGAMMIGFFLACSFILLTQDQVNADESKAHPVNALWCVGLVLLNAFRVIWKRLIKKISIFNSDREHIHHYFLDLGFSSKATLFIVCSISLVISAIGAIINYLDLPEWFSLMAFVSILFFWAFISRYASSIIKPPRESLQSSK